MVTTDNSIQTLSKTIANLAGSVLARCSIEAEGLSARGIANKLAELMRLASHKEPSIAQKAKVKLEMFAQELISYLDEGNPEAPVAESLVYALLQLQAFLENAEDTFEQSAMLSQEQLQALLRDD